MADIQFDYFTAAETEQYTFYRIPKALFTENHFQALSCEAKVLYGMMLDRQGLSIRNQWFDSQGRAYIIFTVEDVMGVMGCQSQKAVRLMKELDTADGIGLIEKKRIGLGRPNRIYVKNFMVGGNGGSNNGTGGARRIQTQAADILHSSGLSGNKAAEPEGRPDFSGEMPEVNADAENTAGRTAAVMAEEQVQNWWMCGESISENERFGKTDAVTGREENVMYEENWWDMETDASSGTEIPEYGMPLCASAAGTVPGIECDADIVDNVDIVDNSHLAVNYMAEYQNSGQNACFSLKMQAPENGTDTAVTGYSRNLLPGRGCRIHILTAADRKPAAMNRFLLIKQWKPWCVNFYGDKKQDRTAAPWNAARSRRPLLHRPAGSRKCRPVKDRIPQLWKPKRQNSGIQSVMILSTVKLNTVRLKKMKLISLLYVSLINPINHISPVHPASMYREDSRTAYIQTEGWMGLEKK